MCYVVWKQTQRTATNPRPIQVWFGSGPTLGHCFARAATLHYPFSRDEVDGTGKQRLLARSSEVSKASTSVEQNHKGSPRTAVGHRKLFIYMGQNLQDGKKVL